MLSVWKKSSKTCLIDFLHIWCKCWFGGTASAWPHSCWNVQKVTFGWPLDDLQCAEWDAVGGVGSSVAWVYHQSFFCLWMSVFCPPVKTGEDRPWEHIRARTRSFGQQTLETNGQTGGREEVWNPTGAFSIASLSYLLITSAAVSQLKPTFNTSHPNTFKWSFKSAAFYFYLRNFGSYLF